MVSASAPLSSSSIAIIKLLSSFSLLNSGELMLSWYNGGENKGLLLDPWLLLILRSGENIKSSFWLVIILFNINYFFV